MAASQSKFPKYSRLVDYLDWHASERPLDQAAVDQGNSLHWARLQALVNKTAEAIKASGIRPGERLVFAGPPGLAYWTTFLACQRAGCVWVGLNPQYTKREFAHVLSDSMPTLLVSALPVESVAGEELTAAASETMHCAPVELGNSVDEIAKRIAESSIVARDRVDVAKELAASDVALVVYTSGSTGAPKGALITQAGLIENGWWLAARLGFEPHRTLANLPVNHIGCVGDVCATALVSGGALVFMPKFDPAVAVEVIREQKIEWIPQVPTQFQLMVAKGGLCAEDLKHTRRITWGGAAMPRGLIATLRAWVPDLFNSYGLTECSGTITVTKPDADLDVMADTVGAPVAPDLVAVTDEEGNGLALNECGEVRIRGRHLFHGYLNNPSATHDAMTKDGWLRTGDLGAIDSGGNLRLLGRTQEMFKSGGYNVYPREIEAVIEAMPEVELCAVVSTPDELWQEVGVAFVQADSGTVSSYRLEEHCRQSLARYKVPKRFVVCDDLPLLPVGKVDKSKLSELARAGDGLV